MKKLISISLISCALFASTIQASPFKSVLATELKGLLQLVEQDKRELAIDKIEEAFGLTNITSEDTYKFKLKEIQTILGNTDYQNSKATLESRKKLALSLWPLFFNEIIDKDGCYFQKGYIYFSLKDSTPMEGIIRSEDFLKTLSKIKTHQNFPPEAKDQTLIDSFKTRAQELLSPVVGNYKLHLMPKFWDNFVEQTTWIQKLALLFKRNNALQKIVPMIKITMYTGKPIDDYGNNFPLIVIYPTTGKKYAQESLNLVYNELKSEMGNGNTPRHNKKVTDLIYFAQSDADYKEAVFAEDFFTKDKVYLDADKISALLGSPKENYELNLPK